MTKRQTEQYDMLVRLRKFGLDHLKAFPEGSEGHAAFAAIAAAIARLEASATTEHTTLRKGLAQKAEAKRTLRMQLEGIAKTARIIARAQPGADSAFQLPPRQSDLATLTAARAFLHEAPAMKEAFVRCGLVPTFVEDLQTATDAFALAVEGRMDGRSGSSKARTGLRSAWAQAKDAATALDVFVANVLGKDDEAIAEWKRIRRVVTSRPSTTTAEEPPAATPVTPSSESAPAVAEVTGNTGEDPLRRAS